MTAHVSVMIAALVALATFSERATPASPAQLGPAASTSVCDADALLVDARAALQRGSPALQRYVRRLLHELALVTPTERLLRELELERDPAMLEALGAAIARKAAMVEDPSLVASLVRRAVRDGDPALRAAAVRALRGTGSVELMERAGVDVSYLDLVRDPSATVRAEVAANLLVEDQDVYSGQNGALAEVAVAVARATEDAAVGARILEGISTAAIGDDTVSWLARTLHHEHASLRAAAARALGGVGLEQAPLARSALLDRFLIDDNVAARRELLAALARLERARAIPLFESLRAVDPRLEQELDAWIAVLRLGLPEWSLIERQWSRR